MVSLSAAVTRSLAVLIAILLFLPLTALAETQRYYANGVCFRPTDPVVCRFVIPEWVEDWNYATITVEDGISGHMCFKVQWILHDGSYLYSRGYGSAYIKVPRGADELNVYADYGGTLDCMVQWTNPAVATVGSIVVEFS